MNAHDDRAEDHTDPDGASLSLEAAQSVYAAPMVVPNRLVPSERLRGRSDIVSRLDRLISGDRQATTESTPRVWVLHGLGGCGKTTIACEVAHRAREEGVEVWWRSAGTPAQVLRDMLAVAFRVGAAPDALDRQSPADGLWDQLDRYERPWLLIIDGVDDVGALELHGTALAKETGWLRRPGSFHGFVLVTTKLGDSAVWGGWCHLEQVGRLDSFDSGKVLVERVETALGEAASEIGDLSDAEDLGRTLAGLPLALGLAADYLVRAYQDVFPKAWVPTTYSAYKDIFEFGMDVSSAEAMRLSLDERSRELIRLDLPVVRSWQLTLNLLDGQGVRLARPLLRLFACFGPAPIPYLLILDERILAKQDNFRGCTYSELGIALEGLRSVGLVDLSGIGRTARSGSPLADLHPVVRRTNRLVEDVTTQHNRYRLLLADLLQHALEDLEPTRVEDWPALALLRPHCSSPLDLGRHLDESYPPETVARLSEPERLAGIYLRSRGFYADAQRAFESVYRARHDTLGLQSEFTLQTMDDLAGVLHDRGRPLQAETEYQRVRALRAGLLGEDHLDTVHTRTRVAEALRDRGEHEAAEQEYRLILEVLARKAGLEHRETLEIRQNLAFLLHARGLWHEADTEYEIALDGLTATIGADALLTLTTKHNYARLKQDSGDVADAEQMFREVLAVRVGQLGDTHRDTLNTRHALAFLLHADQQFEEAETEYQQILDVHMQEQGQMARETLGVQHNIARLARDRGHTDEAESQFVEIVRMRSEVLGHDHPDTLVTRLALTDIRRGRTPAAEIEGELRAIADAQQHGLGKRHPDTLRTQHDLAINLQDQGKLDEASIVFSTVAQHREAVLGPGHPESIDSAHGQAYLLYLRGDHNGALAALTDVLEAELDRDEPREDAVLGVRHNRSRMLAALGRLTDALAEIEHVIAERQRLLGDAHPDTVEARLTREYIRGAIGQDGAPE